jgi:MFS family permease
VSLGFLPYVLFSTWAGVLADRFSRSSVLRWSIGLRILLSVLITAGFVLDWPVPGLIALAALSATLGTPGYPALAAATPQLVEADDLPSANTLVTGIENAGWVAGPGLLGLLLLLGAPVAGGGLAATLCFAVAFATLGRLRLPAAAPELTAGDRSAVLDGLRVVSRPGRVRTFMLLAVLDNALYGYVVVALVLIGERVLGTGETGIGWLNAMFAVGAFASMLVAPRLAARHSFRWLTVTLVLFVGCGVALAVAPTLAFAAVEVFFAGLFTVVAEIIAVTSIQRTTPNAVASRVFGLYDTLAILAIAVTTGLAGLLSEIWGVRPALFAAATITGVLVVVVAVAARSGRIRGPVTAVGSLPRMGTRPRTVPAASRFHWSPSSVRGHATLIRFAETRIHSMRPVARSESVTLRSV